MAKDVTIKFSRTECFDLSVALDEYLEAVKFRKIRTSIGVKASQKRINDLRKLFFKLAHEKDKGVI